MARLVEMGERVGVHGVLAAADMAAGETHAKLIPRGGAESEASLAAIGSRLDFSDLAEVFATLGHVRCASATGLDAPNLNRQ